MIRESNESPRLLGAEAGVGQRLVAGHQRVPQAVVHAPVVLLVDDALGAGSHAGSLHFLISTAGSHALHSTF